VPKLKVVLPRNASDEAVDAAWGLARAAHVEGQLEAHRRGTVEDARIPLDGGRELSLRISDGVFGSDIMSSGFILARFLHRNRHLYMGRDALDMGCGPGTQARTTAS